MAGRNPLVSIAAAAVATLPGIVVVLAHVELSAPATALVAGGHTAGHSFCCGLRRGQGLCPVLPWRLWL
jgi:hypothetical protein